jgi:hypothetical protein
MLIIACLAFAASRAMFAAESAATKRVQVRTINDLRSTVRAAPGGYDPRGAGMILVPEPSTATLVLAGLIFAGQMTRVRT